ncbi:MAG TPA: hypothetical protein PLY87_06570 [Planctomycetaceae bacterium]|nr:hypothetical protein [Planctomycetaceae bacterium]
MARNNKTNAESNSKTTTCRTAFPKGLSQPALRALASAELDHLEQLSTVTESSLLDLHGIGQNALQKLSDAMKEAGMSFAASKTSDSIPSCFKDLWCDNRERQGIAFEQVLELTAQPVDWAYDVWDESLKQLRDKNNRNRSIAAQVLCNLAKSDPAQRLLKDFPVLFDVVEEVQFVTARHALQSTWKVGCVSKKHQELVVAALEARFANCVTHKNYTLIRYDIIECLRKLYVATLVDDIQSRAKALIELESDPKYKKKYSTLWPKK